MKITIGHLYPDLLNLYGDRGNILCMSKRLNWRGIDSEVIEYHLEDEIDFSKLDIILLGGGSDREQQIVCHRLQKIKEEFKAYVERGGVVLAVCGGYQLLGNYYQIGEEKIQGLGIIDMYTQQEKKRLIGNIVIDCELFDLPLVGFENHGGRTYLGNNKPLGKVLYGKGNNDHDQVEGVLYKNVIGTYLHGPLLPKNPHLSDYILQKALWNRYGDVELSPLEDGEELAANAYIVNRFVKK